MQNVFNQEFDIVTVYRKLTAPSKPMLVKANEFFKPQKNSLSRFQRSMDEYFGEVTII